MYVINYPEGGWAIVSATRNYFPVLAHSDKGSFDLETASKSGVSVWMAETKEAMRLSKDLADSVKVQINTQWLAYEEAQKKALSGPQTRGYNEMMNRIDYLYSQYSSLGWYNYYSLDEAYNFLDLQTWQILVNEANSIGASTEYTIVAIKSTYNPNSYTKGPLLTTTWGQDWPFNAACGPNGTPSNPTLSVYPSNHKVGCVAVAAGQIMNYHKEPKSYFIPSNHPNADLFHPTPGWDVIFNWTNMSISATSSMPKLLRAVGEVVYMNYGFSTSSAFLSGIYALENKYGYTDVTEAYHDAAIVKANLSANKPVIMFGVKPSAVIGHSWVCDGVKYNTTITEYFVNFSVNNSYGSYYAYTPFNPGKLSAIAIDGENYNMNWGEGGKNNGWFYDNSFPSGYNFYNSRINYYVTP